MIITHYAARQTIPYVMLCRKRFKVEDAEFDFFQKSV